MNKYGTIHEAVVTDVNDHSYYLQVEGVSYRLPKEYTDEALSLGDQAEGIIYEARNGEARFQVDLPDIRPGYYGWGQVVNVRKDLGIFVDVGLHDKDVVVSLDDLPDLSHLWPRAGDEVYLTYEADDKNQIWGHLADDQVFQAIQIKAPKSAMNQDVDIRIYKLRQIGSTGITSEGYQTFIHESERFEEPRLGQIVQGRIIVVHGDGRTNASLKPRAHEVIDEDAAMLLTLLERSPKGFLPYHDKSDPDLIRKQLGISKKQFKRAIGNLLQQDLVDQIIPEGIYLKASDNNEPA